MVLIYLFILVTIDFRRLVNILCFVNYTLLLFLNLDEF